MIKVREVLRINKFTSNLFLVFWKSGRLHVQESVGGGGGGVHTARFNHIQKNKMYKIILHLKKIIIQNKKQRTWQATLDNFINIR